MKISYKYPFFTLYKKGGNSTMKRILKKSVMLSLVLACLFSENVLARDMEKYNVAKNTYVNTGLLPKTEKTAYDRIQGIEKSTAMGAAISSITNEPKGVIRVFARRAERWRTDYSNIIRIDFKSADGILLSCKSDA